MDIRGDEVVVGWWQPRLAPPLVGDEIGVFSPCFSCLKLSNLTLVCLQKLVAKKPTFDSNLHII